MPESRRKGAVRDAISLLKDDHKKVKQMLSKLESGKGGSAARGLLLQQIESELKVHTQIEEEIFYPAFRDEARSKADKKLYFEAVEEHGVVEMVLPDVQNAGTGDSEVFAAKAKVLKDIVEHHIEEEEEQMFPKARKLLGAAQLRELGAEMQRRKAELQGRSNRRRAA